MTEGERHLTTSDPYEVVGDLAVMRISSMQQNGTLPRATEIEDEDAADEYFDFLMRVYKQVCAELGLAWPPPIEEL